MLLIAAFLGNACDLDIVIALFVPHAWKDIHRQLGHNFMAITLWVWLGRWLILKALHNKISGFEATRLSLLLVLSHVFFDSMQDYGPNGDLRGVPILWPFSNWELISPFRLFTVFHIDEHKHFLLAHITSSTFWHQAVFREIAGSLAIWLCWALVFNLYKAIRRVINPHNRTKSNTAIEKTISASAENQESESRALQS